MRSWIVCRPKLGLAMINLCTKFEVSMLTYCEDTKGNTNVEVVVEGH